MRDNNARTWRDLSAYTGMTRNCPITLSNYKQDA